MVLFMDTIVNLLQQNARLSCKELAAMTGLSEAEVEAKIKEYEHNGIIKGYSAILNEDLADKDRVTAFIEVKVTPKADCGFDDIAKTIMMYDEVERKIEKVKERIREVNQNPDRITFSKVYIPYYSGLANKLNDFDKKIKELNESE